MSTWLPAAEFTRYNDSMQASSFMCAEPCGLKLRTLEALRHMPDWGAALPFMALTICLCGFVIWRRAKEKASIGGFR